MTGPGVGLGGADDPGGRPPELPPFAMFALCSSQSMWKRADFVNRHRAPSRGPAVWFRHRSCICPLTASNLVKWRRAAEAKFSFDPNKGVDPQDVAAVKADIAKSRSDLAARIAQTAGTL